MRSAGLADRVGELVMAGFEGSDIAGVPADLLPQLAGFILFKRNLQSAEQIRSLTDAIRAASNGNAPPLLAIDQEGGPVSRLIGIGTTTPSAMALGATADPLATQQTYALVGSELAALGINLDFAPVADVNNNPDNPVIGLRSFGDQAASVAAHVAAATRGLHAAQVGATAKHFPGHGDTAVDSHFDLPVIRHDSERVRALELEPFRAAIAAGTDAIMTAHILFPALGGDSAPATLSRSILTGLLRDELKFDGVICTDCMEMQAIAATCSPKRAAVMAVSAGADLVLFSHTTASVRAAIAGLRAAVADGRLEPTQIARSLERVSALRRKLALPLLTGEQRAELLATVGSAAHQTAALELARRAVTLVRDPQQLLPLQVDAGERVFLVQFGNAALTPAENAADKQRTAAGKFFASLGARVHEQARTLDPAGHEYKQLLMASAAADVIIVVTTRVAQHPMQARAVADLMLLGKRVVAVASREPYDAAALPADMTVIASFGDDPHALTAAAEVISGKIQARGVLPVRLNGRQAPVSEALQ